MRFLITLLIVSTCGAAAACGDRPGGDEHAASAASSVRPRTRVRFAELVNVDVRHVPLLMAFDELAAEGYDVERRDLTNGTLLTDVLARGDADIAMINNQTVWAAIGKGADIRTIAQFTGSTSVLAAPAAVRTCRELDHRPVGMPTTIGLTSVIFRLYFERCQGTQPQVLVIPESSARAAALLAGRVAATMVPGEELLKLQQQSPATPFHALMSYASEFPDLQIDGLHVHRGWAAQHPEAVRAFLRAELRAKRLIAANPERLYDEAVRRLGMDASAARLVGQAHLQMGIWDPNGGLTPENVQSTIDFLVKAQALPEGVLAAQVSDLSFLDAVLTEIGRTPARPPADGGRPSR